MNGRTKTSQICIRSNQKRRFPIRPMASRSDTLVLLPANHSAESSDVRQSAVLVMLSFLPSAPLCSSLLLSGLRRLSSLPAAARTRLSEGPGGRGSGRSGVSDDLRGSGGRWLVSSVRFFPSNVEKIGAVDPSRSRRPEGEQEEEEEEEEEEQEEDRDGDHRGSRRGSRAGLRLVQPGLHVRRRGGGRSSEVVVAAGRGVARLGGEIRPNLATPLLGSAAATIPEI